MGMLRVGARALWIRRGLCCMYTMPLPTFQMHSSMGVELHGSVRSYPPSPLRKHGLV